MTLIDWDATAAVLLGWFFDGTIASNTRFALVLALVLFWLLSLVPGPRKPQRAHYWIEPQEGPALRARLLRGDADPTPRSMTARSPRFVLRQGQVVSPEYGFHERMDEDHELGTSMYWNTRKGRWQSR